MATSKSYFPRSNHRFLPRDQGRTPDSMIFELDESELWNSDAHSHSPEFPKPISTAPAAARGGIGVEASAPVKVPDWSKILKDEYKENRRKDSDDDDYGEENRIPPHEFLARSKNSFSVQEGIGRKLKGRDLSRVRNTIWQKIGFED